MSGLLDYGHGKGTSWKALNIIPNDHENYDMETAENRSDGRSYWFSDLEFDRSTLTETTTNNPRRTNSDNRTRGDSIYGLPKQM